MSLATISEASKWASNLLNKEILPNNISYLVQYGKVKKQGENGSTLVDLNDLKKYYDSIHGGFAVDNEIQILYLDENRVILQNGSDFGYKLELESDGKKGELIAKDFSIFYPFNKNTFKYYCYILFLLLKSFKIC